MATGMQNGDEASPSIILAGRGFLLTMLITLEPHCIPRFLSTFTFILCLDTDIQYGDEASTSIGAAGHG